MDRVTALLHTIAGIAGNIQNEQIKRIAVSNIDKLSKQHLNLVVLGQFKRGKTTVINAMLGDNVLPSAVVPLTSIITRLTYNEKKTAQVRFYNESKKDIPFPEIGDYVTEKGNPDNTKGVDHVEIGYPSEYLRQGIVLVDTPGIGSTFAHNTAVAYNYLPSMDAGIFVVSGDPPLSEAEYTYLDSIKGYVAKIFFLFNKIDTMSEQEYTESLDFTRGLLGKKLGIGDIRILPVSARQALQARLEHNDELFRKSNFRQFEESLEHFILKDKSNVLAASTMNRAINLAKDLTLHLELTIRAVNSPLDELKIKIGALQKEINIIEKKHRDMELLLEGDIKSLKAGIENSTEQFKTQASVRLKAVISGLSSAGRQKQDMVHILTEHLKSGIEREFSPWFASEEKRVSQKISRILMDYARAVDDEINNVKQIAADLFSIRVAKNEDITSMDPYSRLWYKVDDIIAWGIDNIPMILPKFFFGNYMVKQTGKRIDEEIDRNSGRARYDLFRRIDSTKDKFVDELENRKTAVIGGILSAVTRAEQLKTMNEPEAKEKLKLLQDYMDQIKAAGL
jgi:translation elongation factor EF-1alpha